MSAAIAYNFFFALVPLAIAAVASLTTLGRSEAEIVEIEETLLASLPPELATFVVDLINEAHEIVGRWDGPVVAISLLIALYAGSRGIYAIQKALRQVQDVEEDRPWVVARGLGIAFTIGAGIALIGGYVVVLFGGFVRNVLEEIGINTGSFSGLSLGVLCVWLMLVLYAIYRWGPPVPMKRPLVAAAVATVLLVLMTWLAAYFIPAFDGSTLAALGAVGVVLVWLYAVGFVIITVPALTKPTEAVIRGQSA